MTTYEANVIALRECGVAEELIKSVNPLETTLAKSEQLTVKQARRHIKAMKRVIRLAQRNNALKDVVFKVVDEVQAEERGRN